MYGKYILAIACSGVLTVGMAGAVIAQENTADEGYQGGTSENDASTSPKAQSQSSSQSADATGDTMAKGEGTSADGMTTHETTPPIGTAEQDQATSQGQSMAQDGQAQPDAGTSSGMIMVGKEARNRQGEQLGRVAGVVIDEAGRVQAIVIGTGKAGTSGENQFVVVPRDGVQMQSQAAGQDPALTRQQRLMGRMMQQLERQQLEIGLLRQQLARRQLSMQSERRAAQSSMNRGGLESFHAQRNPLSRVDTVVVDRFGRVQAIVLKSGIVLAPRGTAGAGAGSEFKGFERQASPAG